MQTQTQPYMTTREAAALLRVDPQVIARKAHRGELKGYRLGTSWRFLEDDLKSSLVPNFKGKR